MLRRPIWWWVITILFALICTASLLVRARLGAEQARLLRQNGWIVYSFPKTHPSTQEVTSLAAGPAGRLWVGARQGLHVFDGEGWEFYLTSQHSQEYVSDLAVDSEGRVWAASAGGLHVIADGQVQTIERGHLYSPALATDGKAQVWAAGSLHRGIAPVTIQGIGESLPGTNPDTDLERARAWVIAFDPDGRMWVGTSKGISVYDGEQWHDYTRGQTVTTIAFDSQGQVWVSGETPPASSCCLLATFDSQRWIQHWIPLPGQGKETPFDAGVSALAFDTQGRLWVTFYWFENELDFGLGMYDGENWTFYQTSDAVDPLSVDTDAASGSRALLIDETGRLWVGVGPKLVAFDLQTSLPATDPVPDTVFDRQRTNHSLTWGSAILAAATTAVAAWSTFLNSKLGHNWARQLQARADAMSQAKGRIRSWVLPTLSGMAGGLSSVVCIIVFYFSSLQGPTNSLPWMLTEKLLPYFMDYLLDPICSILGPSCLVVYPIAGLGTSAVLFIFGALFIHRRRTPTQLVLGLLVALIGSLTCAATLITAFWVYGMLAAG